MSACKFPTWSSARSPAAYTASPALYYQEGGSEKHLRDITGMLKTSPAKIDREYIERWAATLNVSAEWKAVVDRVSKP